MARTIALLSGVNVGGRHALQMAPLRAALEDAGCTDVATYVQSGNVALTPPKSHPKAQDLPAWLERVIGDVAGLAVPVVLRTKAELERTIARNSYPDASGTQLHVVFFATAPARGVLEGIDVDSFAPEECTLDGKELYLHLPNGMGRAKLPAVMEKAARRAKSTDVGTARNWNTVRKLVELAAGSAE